MSMDLTTDAVAELTRVHKSDGDLSPERVVSLAKNQHSALHRYFEWDNDKAAHQHRLTQARSLIREARVHIVPRTEPRERKIAVSVPANQERTLVMPPVRLGTAMSDIEVEGQLYKSAIAELAAWKKRYGRITALQAVHYEIDRLLAGPAPRSNVQMAAKFVRVLEDKGLDRRTAAERAASRFGVTTYDVLEQVRAAS
jgi:hypothetical protein